MNPDVALTLILKRWVKWQKIARYQFPSQQEDERQNLLKLYHLYKKMKNKNGSKKSYHPYLASELPFNAVKTFEEKEDIILKGDSALVVHMQPVDYKHYFDYIRMDVEIYNELFNLVESKIKKQYLIKYPVPAHTRLQVCLRYLASGDSMFAIGAAFGVATNTVSKIVTEICQVIWDVLKDIVLPVPTKEMWEEKALLFRNHWNFPHCIGVIDKRQFILQSAVTTESTYCKKKECLAFFAIIDANSCFSYIDIKIENSYQDGINFSETEFYNALQNNTLNIPPPSNFENVPELPYVLIGDETFVQNNNLLIPYTSNVLDLSQQVFNYRLNRAKKCAECAFNIFFTQWKIFHKKFSTIPANTSKIAKAAVCLHNFLMMKENTRPFQDRRYSLIQNNQDSTRIQGLETVKVFSDSSNEDTEKIRNIFKELFCEDGAILLEWE